MLDYELFDHGQWVIYALFPKDYGKQCFALYSTRLITQIKLCNNAINEF